MTFWNGQLVTSAFPGGAAGKLQRWTGSAWVALNDSLYQPPAALLSWGQDLIAGGSTFLNKRDNPLAQYDGTSWSLVQPAWSPGMAGIQGGYVAAATEWNGHLVVTGFFSQVGNQTGWIGTGRFASWDGTSWSALPSGPFEVTYTLGTFQGDLVVGGHFSTAGGVSAKDIARWNGSTWSAMGAGFVDPGYSAVSGMTTYGTDLVAVGDITQSGTTTLNKVARWNGSGWQSIGGGLDNPDVSSSYAASSWGTDLVVGGYFTSVGGVTASNIVRWDGSSWHDIGGGVDGVVGTLAVFEGDLIVGGGFTHAGGVQTGGVARWNGSSWSAMGSNAGDVYSLLSYGGHLFALGDFTKPDASVVVGLASWNGQTWTPLGSGFDGAVGALAAFGGDLYVGGSFGWANGHPSFNIARWQGLSQVGVAPPREALELGLAAPRPNPSRGISSLAFTLPSSDRVRLAIFDASGRRVATLLDGVRGAGRGAVEWNGRDGRGRHAAPGLYFARLETTHGARVAKLVRME